MPFALISDEIVAPQGTHDVDLFFDALAAIAEIHAERLIFDVVPADADTEPEAALAQDIDGGGLFGDQRRLPLRQDDDAAGELDFFGDAGEISVKHEQFVKTVGMLVGAFEVVCRGVAAEHMIEGQDMVEAEAFHGLRIIFDGGRIGADFGLRKHGSNTHLRSPNSTVCIPYIAARFITFAARQSRQECGGRRR